jgi:hypothetical protein
MAMTRYFFLSFTLAVAIAACAAPAGVGGSDYDANRISAAEIAETDVRTAYELVQRLRPRWLTTRPDRSHRLRTVILVYVDGARLGEVDSMRQISVDGIRSMQYLSSSQAGHLPGAGSDHVQAAIVINTRDP